MFDKLCCAFWRLSNPNIKYKRCCQSRGSRFDGAGVFLKTGLSWPGAWLIVGCTRIVLPGLHLHLPQLPLSHVPAITPEILLQWSVALNAACSSNWSRCAAYLLCKKPASAFESLDALRGEGGGSQVQKVAVPYYINTSGCQTLSHSTNPVLAPPLSQVSFARGYTCTWTEKTFFWWGPP